jgi:hypothetical protein
MFMPHSNEFIFIWLYFAFTVYFWVQVAFILTEDDQYGFKEEENYRWMLLATSTLAICVTFTLVYLVFYCISLRAKNILSNIEWNLQLLTIYVLILVFL